MTTGVSEDWEVETDPLYTTVDRMVLDLKNLASWLESLPPTAELHVGEGFNTACMVPFPHQTALHLRLALPAESRA